VTNYQDSTSKISLTFLIPFTQTHQINFNYLETILQLTFIRQ